MQIRQNLGTGIDHTAGWREEEAGRVKEQTELAMESHAHLCSGTWHIVFQVFTLQSLKFDYQLRKGSPLCAQRPVEEHNVNTQGQSASGN